MVPAQGLDRRLAGNDPAYAQAGHTVGFGETADAHDVVQVHGTIEDTGKIIVIKNQVVIHFIGVYLDTTIGALFQNGLHGTAGIHRPGGVVRVVQDQRKGAGAHGPNHIVRIQLVVVLGPRGNKLHLTPGHPDQRCIQQK